VEAISWPKCIMVAIGVACLTALEITALCQHQDGAMFGLVAAIIGGAIGASARAIATSIKGR